jgi:hypothetical protein
MSIWDFKKLDEYKKILEIIKNPYSSGILAFVITPQG